jgi:hypothetical protein
MPLHAEEAKPQGEGEYAPQPIQPVTFDTFVGINTQASRPGIADTEMSWCDGFMPIGKNNLRTLPDVGPAIYVAGTNKIVWFDFANIGSNPVCIAFFQDGSIRQINTLTLAVAQIAPAGTINDPSRGSAGLTQWGNQFIVIVADQTNGYFAWDGSVFYQAGTIAPLVNITNSGLNYTSQPNIIVETTGPGTGPTFQAVLNNDNIEQINVINPGSGFGINDFVNLVIQGGGSDNTARASVTIGPGGGIQEVVVLNGGSGYAFGTSATVVGGGGTGARVQVEGPVPDGGANNIITGITVLSPGTGYTSPPTIQLHNVDAGSGATFAVAIYQGVISTIGMVDQGTGYIESPTVTLIGDGTGGTFVPQINSAGQVTGVIVKDGGQGYTKALVHFSGGNNAAEATVDMMPYGIKGTDAETYQSRVWVANDNKLSFTSADSMSDFSTSNGGGTIEATDSFLRNQYTALKQTNGFLYLIADSSENYVSGVTTTGTPPSTTFNNQNADPEIGTSWPASVDVLSRNIVFANPIGVHVSYGGAITKISDDLDGIYTSVPNFGGILPSAAKAIIYGKKIWMLLLPVVDPISGQQVNKLFMWNGKKWFTSQQGLPLIYIQHQELNSQLTAYGTDGTRICPLFQTPSTNFTKTVQSKLWDKPGGYMFTKTASRLWGLVYFYNLASATLTASIDNENGNGGANAVPVASAIVLVINALSQTVTMINTFGAAVVVYNSGVGVVVFTPNAVGQQGHLMGITLSTNCADMAIISIAMDYGVFQYDG